MKFYAHSLEGRDPGDWEPLEDHLRRVAELAAKFTAKWGAGEWGSLAGWWHDLGKYSIKFQNMLLSANGFEAHLEVEDDSRRVDHSTAGAIHAVNRSKQVGRLLAYCIAGHHAGLPDFGVGRSELEGRISRTDLPIIDAAPSTVLDRALPNRFSTNWRWAEKQDKVAGFQGALFCRMLFSALVDADFLATEEFMNTDQSRLRLDTVISMSQLSNCLLNFLNGKCQPQGTPVNACRYEILQSCLSAAKEKRGLFSLTVPTGGGKTLSSLAFALKHAEVHGMERVVVAIPFTSIIEQTAQIYRDLFSGLGEDVVIEHHSNFDLQRETVTSRLKTENWDAPLIVTTNVQLLESLFAARTSRCRKLHRLANSVIILDEAQTLPITFLTPCLLVLQELVRNYGCSIVLCTATQPALNQREGFSIGFENVREIIDSPAKLAKQMKRVQVSRLGVLSDSDLTAKLREQESCLCILNTRPHASRVYSLLKEQSSMTERVGLFHLSTRMCPVHRSDVLREIRRRLSKGKPCHVISTQLIEAGVDIDFPVVFRSLTGLDSIAQAAGRCNREGNLEIGQTFIFEPEGLKLSGMLYQTAQTTQEVLALPGLEDLLGLEAIEKYFRLHYWNHSDQWDKEKILDHLSDLQGLSFNFRKVEKKFRLIEETGQPVVIPWKEEGKKLCDRLVSGEELSRRDWRMLQRYTVSVFDQPYAELVKRGDIRPNEKLPAILINTNCYDPELGLCVERAGQYEPEALIC